MPAKLAALLFHSSLDAIAAAGRWHRHVRRSLDALLLALGTGMHPDDARHHFGWRSHHGD